MPQSTATYDASRSDMLPRQLRWADMETSSEDEFIETTYDEPLCSAGGQGAVQTEEIKLMSATTLTLTYPNELGKHGAPEKMEDYRVMELGRLLDVREEVINVVGGHCVIDMQPIVEAHRRNDMMDSCDLCRMSTRGPHSVEMLR